MKKNYDEKEEICFLDLSQDCQKNPPSQNIIDIHRQDCPKFCDHISPFFYDVINE